LSPEISKADTEAEIAGLTWNAAQSNILGFRGFRTQQDGLGIKILHHETVWMHFKMLK